MRRKLYGGPFRIAASRGVLSPSDPKRTRTVAFVKLEVIAAGVDQASRSVRVPTPYRWRRGPGAARTPLFVKNATLLSHIVFDVSWSRFYQSAHWWQHRDVTSAAVAGCLASWICRKNVETMCRTYSESSKQWQVRPIFELVRELRRVVSALTQRLCEVRY